MRNFTIAAVVLVAIGLAAPASAGIGQCYEPYGVPVGPAYDTDHPNYRFIESVIRRGGSCY